MFTIVLKYVLQIILIILVVLANIINILVFIKIGLPDSVTLSLFSLAVADLAYLFIFLTAVVINVPEKYFGIHAYDSLENVSVAVIFYAFLFLDISILITVFLAVQKACCVTIPLAFNSTFTLRNTNRVILCIYTGVFLYYSPLLILTVTDLYPVYSTQYNETIILISTAFLEMSNLNAAISKTILPIVASVAVLACLIIMSKYLMKASKFRKSMVSFVAQQGKSSLNTNTKTTKRDIRMIQSVLSLSILFVAANVPVMLIYGSSLSAPGFSGKGHLDNLSRPRVISLTYFLS